MSTVFQPAFFRGYVSFWGRNKSHILPNYIFDLLHIAGFPGIILMCFKNMFGKDLSISGTIKHPEKML